MIKLICSVSLLSSLAGAQEFSILRTYQTQLCNYWSYAHIANGPSGYICTGYPSSANVADGNSTADLIRSLNDKISRLEARVEALEKK